MSITDATSAVKAALASMNGGETYAGICDHYVGLLYGQAHSGYDTAKAHWAASKNKNTSGSPDVGALVYFDTGKPAGHVAIVTGYDRQGNALIVTTHTNGGKPTQMRLKDSGLTYLGSAAPYFSGATTKTIPAAEAAANPIPVPVLAAGSDDTSGIDSRDDVSQPRRSVMDEEFPTTASNQGIPERDALSGKELANEYGFAHSIIHAVPKLWEMFQQAAEEDWDAPKIKAAIQSSQWYKNNSEYAREAWMGKWAGGADWEANTADAKKAVQMAATGLGVTLTPAQMTALSNRYLFEGWNKRANGEDMLHAALAGDIQSIDGGLLQGSSGNLQERLQSIAAVNGVTLTAGYYEKAAQAVARGERTHEDFERDIRQQAASMWPTWSEQIKSGMDVKDLASGYINTMAKVFEVDPNSIQMDDKYLRQAMTKIDPKTGQPVQQGLWDFETALKADPRAKGTKWFTDSSSSVALDVLRNFGLTG